MPTAILAPCNGRYPSHNVHPDRSDAPLSHALASENGSNQMIRGRAHVADSMSPGTLCIAIVVLLQYLLKGFL